MARKRSRIGVRLRRALGVGARRALPASPEAAASTAPAAALRGLGEPPATGTEAAEAELDTLRGELVRELDRMAEGDEGSGSFRRIAS